MDLWDWSLGELTDTEMKATLQGGENSNANILFLFLLFIGLKGLKANDNLSRTLQSPSMLAAQGNSFAQSIGKSLEKFRNEESFPKRLEDCFGYGTSDN